MKLLANRKVKLLFVQILLCLSVFLVLSVVLVILKPKQQALYTLICLPCMGIAVLVICYRYFKVEMESGVVTVLFFMYKKDTC